MVRPLGTGVMKRIGVRNERHERVIERLPGGNTV
jgi:hypothetical protein